MSSGETRGSTGLAWHSACARQRGLSTVDRREIWRRGDHQPVPIPAGARYLAVVLRMPSGELLSVRLASTSTRKWISADRLNLRTVEVMTNVANAWRAEHGMRPAQVLAEAEVRYLRAVRAEALLAEQD